MLLQQTFFLRPAAAESTHPHDSGGSLNKITMGDEMKKKNTLVIEKDFLLSVSIHII